MRGDQLRSSRVAKKKNRKAYIRNILLAFLVIIPASAIITSAAIHIAISKDKGIESVTAILTPQTEDVEAFKYNFDIEAKTLYRVEFKRFDKYGDAEALIAALKDKGLNGFIIKEQGFVTAYGLFPNKSQADTAAEFLQRKKIKSTISVINIKGLNLKYDDIDKDLIDLAFAVDEAAFSIIREKSALSLESLYSGRQISGTSLNTVIELEVMLAKYLNYLENIKTSEANARLKQNLDVLIKELLADKLKAENGYDYYNLQNSLMNQGEALKRFYEKLII